MHVPTRTHVGMYVCMYACLRCTWQPAPVEVLLSLSHVLVVSYCQLARPHPMVFADAVGQLHLAARVRLVHLPRSFRACAQSSARSVAGSSWELRAGLPRPKDLEDKLAGSRMSMSMLEGYLHSFTACCDSARWIASWPDPERAWCCLLQRLAKEAQHENEGSYWTSFCEASCRTLAAGLGHVNEQPHEYVIRRLEEAATGRSL